jgi:zona occludens toxin (predicted ATPase)
MNRTQKNKALYRERMTIMLVVFFCMLISGSERFISFSDTDIKMEHKAGETSSDEQTFVSVAVDAVVPFATTVAQNAFYLIYEILGFETEKFSHEETTTQYTSHFLEILLTRIISPNAP